MKNQTSDLQIPRSDALPLSHSDSTMSKVYREVHLTCILHTARISNVDGVVFVMLMTRRLRLILQYSLHIYHTALYTFPKVIARRICLTVKSLFRL